MVSRKGQAALEFLMTYGWAILVVLAAVGALAYFGVLSPGNFIPDQCAAGTGIGCVGKPDIQPGYVQVLLVNSLGQQLQLNGTNFSISSNNAGTNANVLVCSQATLPGACGVTVMTIPDGTNFKVVFNATNPGNTFRGTFTFNYTDANTGFTGSNTISVSGRVKR